MGTAIAVRSSIDLQALISSPELLQLRRISLGTVKHPGQPTRKYLSGGLTLTADVRTRIGARLAEMRAVAEADDGQENRKSRLALIASMLMAYPMAGGSEETGKARAQAYLAALDDVPPWAIADAIKRWHKGQFSGEHNYRFAPAPAELREGCMHILQPAKQTIAHLEDVLSASTIDEAMDPAARAATPSVPRLKVIR
jgi:hypothetical protein